MSNGPDNTPPAAGADPQKAAVLAKLKAANAKKAEQERMADRRADERREEERRKFEERRKQILSEEELRKKLEAEGAADATMDRRGSQARRRVNERRNQKERRSAQVRQGMGFVVPLVWLLVVVIVLYAVVSWWPLLVKSL